MGTGEGRGQRKAREVKRNVGKGLKMKETDMSARHVMREFTEG